MKKFFIISLTLILFSINTSIFCSQLLSSNTYNQKNLRTSSILNNTVTEFLEGLLVGSKVFEGVPDIKTCNPFDQKLIDTILSFLNFLSKVSQENWKHNILHFIAEFYDLYDRGYSNLKGCKDSLNESVDLYKRINLYINSEGYLQKILINAIQKFFNIKDMFEKTLDFLNKKESFKAGNAAGELIDYVFFFDFILN
jgi:hypothetical protein